MLVCVCLETYVGYRLHVLVATGEASRGHDDAQYIRDSRDSIEGQSKLQRVGRVEFDWSRRHSQSVLLRQNDALVGCLLPRTETWLFGEDEFS